MRIAPIALLAASVSTPALAGQLTQTVVPVSYEISVTPDAKAMTFTGIETAVIDVKAPTATIVLNQAELTISAAKFDGKMVPVALDAEAQTLTITLPKAAKAGKHTLSFVYAGKINESAAGMFAIDYRGQDGNPSKMIVTQFEAPDARRFAPLFDEPSFKASFKLSAVAPAGQTAFSNMPAASVTKQADGSSRYTFGETPVMSSYLLFLGVGDVERHTVQAGPTEIGVITRKGTGDQTDYALSAAAKLLPYYNDYFGQPYPLPKLDMIGGPGSSQFFGAMENWGAIFYFENELLFDKTVASDSQKQRIYIVIAHEMAHQWFGDLVTMQWWDDLWLNEGFASWMEGKSTGLLNPQWDMNAQAVGERDAAMALDSVSTTHPIIRHLETPDQIGQAFDSITYQKGQAVINMMEATVGPDAFQTGVRSYMAKHKYGNTVTDDLWAEVSAAAPGVPVKDIAHDFTMQGGVPLVSVQGVTCTDGQTSAMLNQSRFGLDAASQAPQTWRVPVKLGVVGGGVGSGIVQGANGTAVTATGCGTTVVNLGKAGYYRVQYDGASHAAIVKDFANISLTDQLGTLSDDYALAIGGYQPLATYLATQGAVGLDAKPLAWNTVAEQFGSLRGYVSGTPLQQPLDARTIATLGPVLQKIGMVPVAGEDALVSQLRETLLGRLGVAGDPQVLALARKYTAALQSDPQAIPPNIRRTILGIYAANATPAEWEVLLKLTQAETNPVLKNGYVGLLGAARDEALAKRALAMVGSNDITVPQRATLLRAIAYAHPELAFDYAVANIAMVDTLNEESSRARYVAGLGSGSNDPAMPGKIDAFAKSHLPAGSRGAADKAINAIHVRQATAERLRADMTTWLMPPVVAQAAAPAKKTTRKK